MLCDVSLFVAQLLVYMSRVSGTFSAEVVQIIVARANVPVNINEQSMFAFKRVSVVLSNLMMRTCATSLFHCMGFCVWQILLKSVVLIRNLYQR